MDMASSGDRLLSKYLTTRSSHLEPVPTLTYEGTGARSGHERIRDAMH